MSCVISYVVEVICGDIKEMQEIQSRILSSGISPVETRVRVDNDGTVTLHVPCATTHHAERVREIAGRVQEMRLVQETFFARRSRARSH